MTASLTIITGQTQWDSLAEQRPLTAMRLWGVNLTTFILPTNMQVSPSMTYHFVTAKTVEPEILKHAQSNATINIGIGDNPFNF
jgi:hypothetical protein